MRGSRFVMVAAFVVAGAGCSDDPDPVRVAVDDLLDVEQTLPDGAAGVDLGASAPAGDLAFCEAFAEAPTDWVDDAVVPLQYWLDTYANVDDEPPSAEAPLAALRQFAEWKLAWNFKQREDRPVYDDVIALHVLALADAAVDHCDALPLVVGPPGRSDAPGWWADETEGSIRRRCDDYTTELDQAIAAYTRRVGRAPGHVAQVEAEAFYAWAYGGDGADLFVGSDVVGVGHDDAGRVAAVAAPGGACDL